MDIRQTVIDHRTFVDMLEALQRSGEKASLLVDINGLERAQGTVTALDRSGDLGAVTLNNGQTIDIKSIVAINGTFLSDYSEC